jgi:hypothetical protein
MSDSIFNSDWDRWGNEWRSGRIEPAEIAALVERTARARRSILGMRVLSFGITVVSLAAVAGALHHAANRLELVLGYLVSLGICTAWIIDTANRRDAHAHAEATPQEYLLTRRALSIRRIRFGRLVWILAGLDLAFLFPWWIGGIRVHGFGFHFMHVASIWLPLAVIIASVLAAARIRARARAELQSIERATE